MLSLKKRGQSSLELIMILSIALIIFLSFFAIFESKRSEFLNEPIKYESKTLLEDFAGVINDVWLGGVGASKIFYVPDSIENAQEFNLSIYADSNLIILEVYDIKNSFPIVTSQIDSQNVLSGGYNITNNGVRVLVNPI